ncbi:MAG TPA: hypothetical protein VJ485_04475 [archaeon]|nr:hypothetical protein [archaeon]
METTLRLRVKYIPNEGNGVKHPSLGYRFLGNHAERVIEKYHLENGAGFEDIRKILQYEDSRNFGLAAEYADFVDVIISRGRGIDFQQKAKRYDFAKREISNLIV